MNESKRTDKFNKLVIRLKKIETKSQQFFWNTRFNWDEFCESVGYAELRDSWDKIHDRFYLSFKKAEFSEEWLKYCSNNSLAYDYNFGDVLA